MKKIDDLITKILQKRSDIFFVKGEREPKLIVYMYIEQWHEIMKELHDELSPAEYSMLESEGDKIMGHNIYRIYDDRHQGIKIFEEE